MKKFFYSLIAAVMMIFMVSCGASEAYKAGEAAAPSYISAFKANAEDMQGLAQAYAQIAPTIVKYQQSGTVDFASFMTGLSSALDAESPSANGSFFGVWMGNVVNGNGGDDAIKAINTLAETAKGQSKNASEFQSAFDAVVKAYTGQ